MSRTDSFPVSEHPPILEGDHLRRIADNGTVLLDDVILTVIAGESVAIVGPPGAGKTLLLRALALLDPLDGGEVRYDGDRVTDDAVPAFRRKVLYVQQRATLVEGTVRDNLLLPFTFRSAEAQSFNPEGVIRWFTALGRGEEFLERTVADLSGGESQLVSLVRALQLNPDVLLLDEPTSSLDEQTRTQVESLLSDWMQDTREGEAPAEPPLAVGTRPPCSVEERPSPRSFVGLMKEAPTDLCLQNGGTTPARREPRPPCSQTTGRALLIVTHDLSQAKRISDRQVRLERGRILDSREET